MTETINASQNLPCRKYFRPLSDCCGYPAACHTGGHQRDCPCGERYEKVPEVVPDNNHKGHGQNADPGNKCPKYNGPCPPIRGYYHCGNYPEHQAEYYRCQVIADRRGRPGSPEYCENRKKCEAQQESCGSRPLRDIHSRLHG